MSKVSCLLALPLERRALMGLADPSSPVVRVKLVLREQGMDFEVRDGTTVNVHSLRRWIMTMASERRQGLDDRELTFEVMNDRGRMAMLVCEDEVESYDPQVCDFAESLVAHMRVHYLNLREAVGRLPGLDELRQHLELVARLRIKLELELDRQHILQRCEWGVTMFCGQHDARSTPDQLVADSRMYDAVRTENIMAAMSGGTFRLRLPIIGLASCEHKTTADYMVEVLQAMSAEALLQELMPQLYAELGIERRSVSPRPRPVPVPFRPRVGTLIIVLPSVGKIGSA